MYASVDGSTASIILYAVSSERPTTQALTDAHLYIRRIPSIRHATRTPPFNPLPDFINPKDGAGYAHERKQVPKTQRVGLKHTL